MLSATSRGITSRFLNPFRRYSRPPVTRLKREDTEISQKRIIKNHNELTDLLLVRVDKYQLSAVCDELKRSRNDPKEKQNYLQTLQNDIKYQEEDFKALLKTNEDGIEEAVQLTEENIQQLIAKDAERPLWFFHWLQKSLQANPNMTNFHLFPVLVPLENPALFQLKIDNITNLLFLERTVFEGPLRKYLKQRLQKQYNIAPSEEESNLESENSMTALLKGPEPDLYEKRVYQKTSYIVKDLASHLNLNDLSKLEELFKNYYFEKRYSASEMLSELYYKFNMQFFHLEPLIHHLNLLEAICQEKLTAESQLSESSSSYASSSDYLEDHSKALSELGSEPPAFLRNDEENIPFFSSGAETNLNVVDTPTENSFSEDPKTLLSEIKSQEWRYRQQLEETERDFDIKKGISLKKFQSLRSRLQYELQYCSSSYFESFQQTLKFFDEEMNKIKQFTNYINRNKYSKSKQVQSEIQKMQKELELLQKRTAAAATKPGALSEWMNDESAKVITSFKDDSEKFVRKGFQKGGFANRYAFEITIQCFPKENSESFYSSNVSQFSSGNDLQTSDFNNSKSVGKSEEGFNPDDIIGISVSSSSSSASSPELKEKVTTEGDDWLSFDSAKPVPQKVAAVANNEGGDDWLSFDGGKHSTAAIKSTPTPEKPTVNDDDWLSFDVAKESASSSVTKQSPSAQKVEEGDDWLSFEGANNNNSSAVKPTPTTPEKAANDDWLSFETKGATPPTEPAAVRSEKANDNDDDWLSFGDKSTSGNTYDDNLISISKSSSSASTATTVASKVTEQDAKQKTEDDWLSFGENPAVVPGSMKQFLTDLGTYADPKLQSYTAKDLGIELTTSETNNYAHLDALEQIKHTPEYDDLRDSSNLAEEPDLARSFSIGSSSSNTERNDEFWNTSSSSSSSATDSYAEDSDRFQRINPFDHLIAPRTILLDNLPMTISDELTTKSKRKGTKGKEKTTINLLTTEELKEQIKVAFEPYGLEDTDLMLFLSQDKPKQLELFENVSKEFKTNQKNGLEEGLADEKDFVIYEKGGERSVDKKIRSILVEQEEIVGTAATAVAATRDGKKGTRDIEIFDFLGKEQIQAEEGKSEPKFALKLLFLMSFFLFLMRKEYFEQQKLKATESAPVNVDGIKKMTKKDVMDYRIQALLEDTLDEVKKSRNKYLTDEGNILQQSDPQANPQQIQEHLREEVSSNNDDAAAAAREKKLQKSRIKYFSLKKARDLEATVRNSVIFQRKTI
jgi:hypothetical protein